MTSAPQPQIEANDVLNILKEKIDLENKENKAKIASLEDEINKYKSLLSTYEEKIKSYEKDEEEAEPSKTTPDDSKPKKYNKVVKIQEQNIIGLKLETEILKSSEEKSFLRNVILNEPNKLFQMQLLYRFTRDGYSFDSFHKKVDFICPLIIVVELESGLKIGATTNNFMKSFKYNKKGKKKDENTGSFVFCFNNSLFGTEDDEISFFEYKEKEKENNIFGKQTEKKPEPKIYNIISFAAERIYFQDNMKNCHYSNTPRPLTSDTSYFGLTEIFGKISSKDSMDNNVKEIEVFTYKFE